jgi:hypothetical protein
MNKRAERAMQRVIVRVAHWVTGHYAVGNCRLVCRPPAVNAIRPNGQARCGDRATSAGIRFGTLCRWLFQQRHVEWKDRVQQNPKLWVDGRRACIQHWCRGYGPSRVDLFNSVGLSGGTARDEDDRKSQRRASNPSSPPVLLRALSPDVAGEHRLRPRSWLALSTANRIAGDHGRGG